MRLLEVSWPVVARFIEMRISRDRWLLVYVLASALSALVAMYIYNRTGFSLTEWELSHIRQWLAWCLESISG
jgi:hypothetical protein